MLTTDISENEDQITPDPDVAQRDLRLLHHRGKGIGHSGRQMHDHLVDEQQHADRRHERRQRVAQGRVAEAADIDEKAEGRRAQRRDQEDEDRRRAQAEKGRHADVGAPDGGGAIGQIELVHHPEDQREPDADQGIGRAEQDTVGQTLHQVQH
jgi:hypothetical protein